MYNICDSLLSDFGHTELAQTREIVIGFSFSRNAHPRTHTPIHTPLHVDTHTDTRRHTIHTHIHTHTDVRNTRVRYTYYLCIPFFNVSFPRMPPPEVIIIKLQCKLETLIYTDILKSNLV